MHAVMLIKSCYFNALKNQCFFPANIFLQGNKNMSCFAVEKLIITVIYYEILDFTKIYQIFGIGFNTGNFGSFCNPFPHLLF